MTLTRSKTELQGKLSEVMEELDSQYPSVALMTKEITACMLLCGVKRLKYSPESYSSIGDVNIKIVTDGEDLFIELLGEIDE